MSESPEELLADLLQDILKLLQSGDWVVADYTANFSNEVSLLNHKSVEKNWNMSVSLKRIKG